MACGKWFQRRVAIVNTLTYIWPILAAALRHLHALRVWSPVFGVIWADGKVKAHVDWCASSKEKYPVNHYSILMESNITHASL
jgi:hypothetical protein